MFQMLWNNSWIKLHQGKKSFFSSRFCACFLLSSQNNSKHCNGEAGQYLDIEL